MSTAFDLKALPAPLGAELVAFDAARGASEADAHALRGALDEHKLLLLRGQSLDEAAQIALLEVFGTPLKESGDDKRCQYVSNHREGGILGAAEYSFHSDHAFMDEPIETISLYAVEIPAGGGRTRFADAVKAARELPDDLRARVGTRRARHVLDPAGDPGVVRVAGEPGNEELPHAFHPILWEHPRTGDPILYVNAQQTDFVEDLEPAEGRALLEDLFAHLYSSAYVYEHTWSEGDLIVWDNRALQHARDALDPAIPRTLRRVSVGGTSVIEFFRAYTGPMSSGMPHTSGGA